MTLLLAGLSMVGPLAIDTYLPSFPAITADYGVSPALVQQTLSLFLFTFAFMMLFTGTLSDSFGRRPVILVGLVVYTAASFGIAFAPSFHWLLLGRALQGLAAAAGSVVGRAVVRDRVSGAEAQRALAHIMMVFGLAPAIAPILGGWLHVMFGWHSVFVFLGSFGLLMLLACARWLPESLPAERRHAFHFGTIVRHYLMALRHRQFLLLALAGGLTFSGFALYIGSASHFVIDILHLSETSFGWMFIPLVTGMVSGSAVAARMAGHHAPRTLVWRGYAVMVFATAGSIGYNFFFVASVPWAVIPLGIYGFGLALVAPSVTLLALDYLPENRGLGASLQAFVQMLIFALVSGVVAPLLFDSALKLACGVGVGLGLSMACWTAARAGR